MSKRKKPGAAKPDTPTAPPVSVPKDKLLELRAESAALWKLLAEGGGACLWNALTGRIHAAIDRLDKAPYGVATEATETIAIRGLIDALFALECAERDVKGFTLDKYDHEAEARKPKGGAS